MSPRNPMIAATLSAVFFPGLGQLYCGANLRGVTVFMATVAATVLVALVDGRMFMVGLLAAMGLGAVDAYRLAGRTVRGVVHLDDLEASPNG